MNRVVIFDMDGVLIDSVTLNWIAYNKVLARYNVKVNQDAMHRYVGHSVSDQVAMFNADFELHIEPETFMAEVDRLREASFAHIQPKPGVLDLLRALQRQGVMMAVGTSTSRLVAERRLITAGILDYFGVVVTEDDVQRHKPDPEVYLTVARRCAVPPQACVVIEDAPSGIAAAKAAGMACVGVSSAYASSKQLAAATTVVVSLADVDPAYLQQLAH